MANMVSRRNMVQRLMAAGAALLSTPWLTRGKISNEEKAKPLKVEPKEAILKHFPLGFQWDSQDPFLFCVHHEDDFPAGNEHMGPDTSHFKGRHMGDDFIIKDGFRMYHGQVVPGFPGHPHRGFETITVVRKGFVDHSDSMGAAGRYGNGDVQWMTAGKGVQHAEMFPLIHSDRGNPMELFQIWLNLPASHKMVEPHFKMLWREEIPYIFFDQEKVLVELIAGHWEKESAVTPPPDSWAADQAHGVLIVNIKMEAHSEITLPIATESVNRSLYFYEGDSISVNGTTFDHYSGMFLDGEIKTTIKTNFSPASIFILQGKPINEQVMQYGPFVMNTKEEIKQAFEDYHETKFGGWPWTSFDQVHPRSQGRFAKHADGKLEERGV